jgi:hypothetical protein
MRLKKVPCVRLAQRSDYRLSSILPINVSVFSGQLTERSKRRSVRRNRESKPIDIGIHDYLTG